MPIFMCGYICLIVYLCLCEWVYLNTTWYKLMLMSANKESHIKGKYYDAISC